MDLGSWPEVRRLLVATQEKDRWHGVFKIVRLWVRLGIVST